MNRAAIVVMAGFAVLLNAGCSVDSAKSRYILAERLWTDGKYAAAVNEFEKVTVKDPKGKLGLQALFRGAMTQMLYLSQYSDAVRKFKAFAGTNADSAEAWDAQKQIGEILFVKAEQYEKAIQHYHDLLKSKPEAAEAPEFLFRIGKSHFFLWQFDDAVATYREIVKRYPGSAWAEKATLEIGETYFTRGENGAGGQRAGAEAYQEAMDAFQKFIRLYPDSKLVAEARFGIASCLEELDQLDNAYHHYEALRDSYPSPKVIEIKLARIRERKAQRSR